MLNGSGTTSPSQTFTATSDNPDIKVNIAQGQFWTSNVSHQAASSSDVTINNQPMTFQFFPDLTPNTVDRITNFTNNGYYTNTGKYFPRILSGFVAQGGSDSPTSTASRAACPGSPTRSSRCSPSTASPSSRWPIPVNRAPDDAQFFITFGPQTKPRRQLHHLRSAGLGLQHAGRHVERGGPLRTARGEVSVPDNPVTINSATLSNTNPNGVLMVDTTSAHAGETAHVTVTATDPTDGTTATQTFNDLHSDQHRRGSADRRRS